MELNINPEFKELIPPLTPEEYVGLEQNILTHGCRTPIDVCIYASKHYQK